MAEKLTLEAKLESSKDDEIALLKSELAIAVNLIGCFYPTDRKSIDDLMAFVERHKPTQTGDTK